MPVEFEIDSGNRIVNSRAWGVIRDGDLIDHQQHLAADPQFASDLNQLYDLREVEDSTGLTADGIRSLANSNPFDKESRRAFLVSSTADYGLSRMFQSLTDSDPETELRIVFDEAYLAKQWLGVDQAK